MTSERPEGWVAVSLVAGAFRGRGLSQCWWWSETQRGGSGGPAGRGVTSGHEVHLPGAVQPLSARHAVPCPWPAGGLLPWAATFLSHPEVTPTPVSPLKTPVTSKGIGS